MSYGSIADGLTSRYGGSSRNIFEALKSYIEANGGNAAGCHDISDLIARLPDGSSGGGKSYVSDEFVMAGDSIVPVAFLDQYGDPTKYAIVLESDEAPDGKLQYAYRRASGGGTGGSGSPILAFYAQRTRTSVPNQIFLYASTTSTITAIAYDPFTNALCRFRAIEL